MVPEPIDFLDIDQSITKKLEEFKDSLIGKNSKTKINAELVYEDS
jgi:hypothetical protein